MNYLTYQIKPLGKPPKQKVRFTMQELSMISGIHWVEIRRAVDAGKLDYEWGSDYRRFPLYNEKFKVWSQWYKRRLRAA